MPSLYYSGPRELEWRDEAAPIVSSDQDAIVRTVAVATCDLDTLIVNGQSPFSGPFVLGHEGVAIVTDVGDAVTSVRPGDRVLVPFQINCGTCGACCASRTGNCESLPLASTYGFGFGEEATKWGGFLSEAVRVPFADAMLMPVPPGVNSAMAASVSDNITDAYRTVGPPLAARPGAPVLIVGGAASGSIGLYAVAEALALGAEHVLYVDADPGRRDVAAGYGARVLDHVPERTDHRYPITVDASAKRDGLALALGSLDRDGICTSAAIYFAPETIPPFPLLPMYTLGATFATGRVHARRDAPQVLDMLAEGTLDVAPVITRTVEFADAAEALLEPYTKLVFTRPEADG